MVACVPSASPRLPKLRLRGELCRACRRTARRTRTSGRCRWSGAPRASSVLRASPGRRLRVPAASPTQCLWCPSWEMEHLCAASHILKEWAPGGGSGPKNHKDPLRKKPTFLIMCRDPHSAHLHNYAFHTACVNSKECFFIAQKTPFIIAIT